jgi:hypothetical protein
MTTPISVALLTRCRAAGVDLSIRGDRLRWSARRGPPDDLLAALVRHKSEVLAALRRPNRTVSQIPEIPESRVYGISGMRSEDGHEVTPASNPLLCPTCGGDSWHVDRDFVVCTTCHPEHPVSELRPELGRPQADRFRQRIARSASWDDLYVILTDAEIAYAAGELSAEDVDLLCDLCRVAHHQLPEHSMGGKR